MYNPHTSIPAIQSMPAQAPAPAQVPIQSRRRSSDRLDLAASVRIAIWTLACVVALWATFSMMKAPAGGHHPKEDHILAAAVGKEAP